MNPSIGRPIQVRARPVFRGVTSFASICSERMVRYGNSRSAPNRRNAECPIGTGRTLTVPSIKIDDDRRPWKVKRSLTLSECVNMCYVGSYIDQLLWHGATRSSHKCQLSRPAPQSISDCGRFRKMQWNVLLWGRTSMGCLSRCSAANPNEHGNTPQKAPFFRRRKFYRSHSIIRVVRHPTACRFRGRNPSRGRETE